MTDWDAAILERWKVLRAVPGAKRKHASERVWRMQHRVGRRQTTTLGTIDLKPVTVLSSMALADPQLAQYQRLWTSSRSSLPLVKGATA
jgi:hypothetical protein